MLFLAIEGPWMWLLIIAASLLIVWALIASVEERRQQASAMEQVVKARGGSSNPGIWGLTSCRALLPMFGREAQLHYITFGSRHPEHYTWLAAPLPGCEGLEFEIKPEGWLSTLGKSVGLDDIQIGDPLFDERFHIKAAEPNVLRALLDEDMLEWIHQLDALKPVDGVFEPDFVEVYLASGVLQIKTRGQFTTPPRLERFVALCEKIGQRIIERQ